MNSTDRPMDIRDAPTPIKRIKRQTVRYQHANPLFDEWLREWQDQARQADSNMQYIFAKARKSLKKFPLPVYNGDDCKVLRFFGEKLCSMIDKRIRQHEGDHGPIDWDEHIKVQKGKAKVCRATKSPAVASSNKRKSKKAAVDPPTRQTKPSKIPVSQGAASKSKNAPSKPTSAPPPSIRTTTKTGRVAPAPAPQPVASVEAGKTTIDASDDAVLFTLPPGSYSVVLCVDCAETTSKNSKAGVVKELSEMGVQHCVRKLHVGDFAWVAVENSPTGKAAREVILPCLVERKRMDDLASSIKDGRCREQKHRLQRCGVDSIIYLVETVGQHRAGLPLSTCHQAVANTAVVDGLLVKWTAGHRESAGYLTLLTRLLQDAYQGKCVSALKSGKLPSPCPVGCSSLVEFDTFNKSAVKNRQLSVREMLAKHLLQVAGLSVDKVTALVNEAPTPRALLSNLSSASGVQKMASVRAGRSGRPVGAAAETLARLYHDRLLR